MINCPKCKSEIEGDSYFCDMCGQEIFYCSQCSRPGKGSRCTFCGGMMKKTEELSNDYSIAKSGITKREAMNAVAVGANHRSGVPQLFLVNDNLHIRLAAVNGAILGRRQGIYQEFLNSCLYISGKHAQLNYSVGQGWAMVDKGSSNGTHVNQKKLSPEESCVLHHGDRVLLANVEFKVEIIER